jgi:hypothetical protein
MGIIIHGCIYAYLLVCIAFHGDNLVKALDLCGLGGRSSLDTAAGQESCDGASKLLCGGNCGERGVLQLALALLENGEGREQAGERRGSGLAQSPGWVKLRAGSSQSRVTSNRNHGDDVIWSREGCRGAPKVPERSR